VAKASRASATKKKAPASKAKKAASVRPPSPPAAGDYVRRVQRDTADYVKDVLAENEKLRALVYALESELDRTKRARLKLEEQLSTIEAECKRYLDRYVDVELQNANVANLYVASLRLHSTLLRADVVSAIQDIVINLIGSEELAIFERVPNGADHLRLIASFGVDARPIRTVPLGAGVIGRAARAGKAHVTGRDHSLGEVLPHEAHLTACVPMVVDGHVTGAVAIFRLLEHKRALEDVDFELFALLGTQGAMALYCSGLRDKQRAS